jgi:anthranilate synthase component 2
VILLIDNYDSFTYNLYDYISQLGYTCHVVRNDELILADIDKLKVDAIVISPGPGVPKDAGNCMEVIREFYNRKPILGICLGYQAIGEYFGAQLKKAIKPMHGKTSNLHIIPGSILFKDISSPTQVMRYHSLILENVVLPLKITGQTIEKEIMAFEHESLPIAGVQFHPESILSTKGLQMIKNWLDSI